MDFHTCPYCKNDGLVHSIKKGTQDRYVFRCSCSFGLVKDKVFPVWERPTRGYTEEIWPIPPGHGDKTTELLIECADANIAEDPDVDEPRTCGKDPFDD
jgi:hypothetical protein